MSIKVKAFAAYAELMGMRELQVEYTDGMKCVDLWRRIVEMYPGISKIPPLFAVKEEYVSPESELNDGDSVMLFPPVSGG